MLACFFGCLTVCLFVYLAGWFVVSVVVVSDGGSVDVFGWLGAWLVDWLVGWLVRSLVG